ncbi:GCN5 family acetyltransferase [Intrasporangium chromatireducens Q5-1]|uniref:GCN5 family acetyltransferase n=1 Tax=Intrasporangium chromatireducens Q5-1 TaxID=584657 RepID=W9GPW5_9MICO|nr:GNAT family N-acetyltransferase [Intrasporangium chromatireducens]EWT07077.1 GCN5 family acetyltransferase [Intrasporangium chromatireducens Q5-1]
MPLTTVTFACTTSPAQARDWVAPLIAREPLWLSVIASNIKALIADPTRYDSPRWWVARDKEAAVVAAFMHTPPHPLHIGLATPEQARDLATVLASQGDALPGVGGVRAPAEAFAAEWTTSASTVRTVMELGVYDLPRRPTLPFAVPGRYRRARPSDVDLTDGWARDFHHAVATAGSPVSTMGHIEAGRLGLWEDKSGEPVSMAYASVPAGGVTRVSGVWTPPEQRAHGYASAVVAALSDERMADGEACMLYTDLGNPTSNGIYRALGYRRIGDSVTLAFG